MQVIFLRQPPFPAPADISTPSPHLRTLSVPLTHFTDTRYMIPVFSAPYYEATVLPVRGGGLPEQQPGGPSATGLLKIRFAEGGGTQFREAVEEVKARMEDMGGRAEHMDELRECALIRGASLGSIHSNH